MNSRHHLRLAPLALAAVLVLGACGSDDPTADSTDGTVPEASADGGLMAPRPVRTGGGGAGTAMSATAEGAPASDRTATDMMMPYRIATFVAGDGLPALPTDDVGHLFEAGATVTAEQVAALAAGLGVTGEPERIDDGYGVSWRVGPDDGTAPSVYVYEDAQLNWSYSSAWADAQITTSCAVAEPGVAADVSGGTASGDVAVAPPETDVVGECVEPDPPANVPSASEAETLARELMVAVGLDPEAFTFEPYADEWAASISAVERIEGSFPGRRFDVSFGADGALQYAGGQLGEPVKVGPYPLVDLETAIARLNDTSGFYAGYGGVGIDRTMMDVAVASEVAVAPTEVGGGSAGSAGSTGGAALPVESMPPESVPAPEEVTVTLVDVVADVWWAWDVDGSLWLLPAYRFTGDDGGTYVVPAVTDQFLVQVPADELPVPETVPVSGPEPMPIDPKPEPMPIETVPDQIAPFDTAQLESSIGKTLAGFTADAEALGASVRVTEIDGVPQAVTADYSTSRINVAVTGEGDAAVVTAIVSVG